MSKSYINPQPFAVDKKNKKEPKNKPSNLHGTELEKDFTTKVKKAQQRTDLNNLPK
ncbi:TPA: hypothetical protein ACPSKE_002965 [Legionella feeleii]